jgi:hypothetical protein
MLFFSLIYPRTITHWLTFIPLDIQGILKMQKPRDAGKSRQSFIKWRDPCCDKEDIRDNYCRLICGHIIINGRTFPLFNKQLPLK